MLLTHTLNQNVTHTHAVPECYSIQVIPGSYSYTSCNRMLLTHSCTRMLLNTQAVPKSYSNTRSIKKLHTNCTRVKDTRAVPNVSHTQTVPGCLGQGPIVLAMGAGGGCLDIFLSSITSLFFLPLSGRRPDID